MLDSIRVLFQHLLPKQLLTVLLGFVAEKQLGWFTQGLIKIFIKAYHVDMQEAKESEPKAYKTFNEFFTRPLKEGVRPIDENLSSLVFPADGKLSQFGDVEGEALVQAKGHTYTLTALLAGNTPLIDAFAGGLFATIYLSPRDYHRLHMPCDGVLREMIYVPGDLFSVNLHTAAHIPNLFARNERLICIFDTEFGLMAQILVGATIVGSIETVWAGCVTPPREGIIQRWTYPKEGEVDESLVIKLKKGQEMGRFKLGSTVINLFVKDSLTFDATVTLGQSTKLGELFLQKK
ncbi:archaetidylserine decarboxylase [Thorsellia anophelis]|uniref:Phosphatidylserine decarboxylase proenzyme n=1 Tax=Thorsellia anophelis DSM 18579 TaxID=1123402 RepID=A0A1H9YT02_9GAMM|nr:archaetidylserine decarboxylase [Thorsellia anophelis]SES72292.1 phosphatidylserine decarboxylase [Thorsellia anophelis DSM 18579]